MRVWLLILSLCLALLTTPLNAQWYKDYERAQDALEKQEWSRAIELLEKLTQRNKKPDPNRRAEGNFRSPYHPYFLLGKAYYGLQELETARENLKESLGYGLLGEEQEAEAQRLLENITNWELAREALARGESQHAAKNFRQALTEFESADRHIGQAGDLSDSGVASRVRELRTEASRAFSDWQSQLEVYRQLREQVQSDLGDERLGAAEAGLAQAAAALDEADRIYPQQSEAERSRQELAQLTSDLQDRMARSSAAVTSESTTEALSSEVETREIDPATERAYGQALTSAEEAYRSNRLQEAIAELEKARQADSQRFQDDGQAQRADSISRQLEQLNQRRRNSITAYRAGDFQGALRGFEELVAYPDFADARSWRDRARAGQVLEEGKTLGDDCRLGEAAVKYREAMRLDPANQDAETFLRTSEQYLQSVGQARQALETGEGEQARQLVLKANTLYPPCFKREDSVLVDLLNRSVGPVNEALKVALLALFGGRVEESIELLENEAETGTPNASLFAYLGVAYATWAYLKSEEQDARTALLQKARDSFARAVALSPEFELSERLVPHKILRLYREAAEGQRRGAGF